MALRTSLLALLTLLLSMQLAFWVNQIYNRIMSEPFKLYLLQQVDSLLDKTRIRLKEIDVALEGNEEVKQAETALENAKEDIVTAEKALRRAEQGVQDQQMRIEQNQNKLYSGKVTIPKELQDLQHEAEAFKRNLDKLEDLQLERMVIFDEMEMIQTGAQDTLNSIVEQTATKNSELTEERIELDDDVERMDGEREAAMAGIPADDLKLYESLRQSRAGVAVAKVNDKSCSACGSGLSQALAQAARSPNTISRCETCGRILYSR